METHESSDLVANDTSPPLRHNMSQEVHPPCSSIRKPMPVTSFVLNFPSLTEYSKSFNMLSRNDDPLDLKNPAIFFHIDESPIVKSIMYISGSHGIAESSVSENSAKPISGLEAISSKKKENRNRLTSSFKAIRLNSIAIISREWSPVRPSSRKTCILYQSITSANKDLEDIVAATEEIIPVKTHLNIPLPSIDQKRRAIFNELLSTKFGKCDRTEELPAEELTMKNFNEKYAVAEALAKASMMTSPAAKRRLAARKIEMEFDGGELEAYTGADEIEYIPPRQLLLYLVRMGSFNSAPKIHNPDSQDDNLVIPLGLSNSGFMHYCKMMRGENSPPLLDRYFLKPIVYKEVISTNIAEGLRVLKLDSISKVCSSPIALPNQLRVLQWNILSQCLGQNNDGFIKCPEEALTWEHRKYLIVEEIVRNNPDIICLQEVDHFKFLERMLGSQNYKGVFFPKPDSPCLYIQENNGPDGCAIFYKRDRIQPINFETRILEVWRVQSNQVAIVANLRLNDIDKEICVCTTHLKARRGALLSKLRNEQGKDLLRFVNVMSQGRPVIMCGDFNAEPFEPIYSTILNYKALGLASAYADLNENADFMLGQKYSDESVCNGKEEDEEKSERYLSPAEVSSNREPPYTTWKIREEGEVCHTIDYIFYSKLHLKVNNCLQFPSGNEIGVDRTPNYQYPSDHFALVCDLEIID